MNINFQCSQRFSDAIRKLDATRKKSDIAKAVNTAMQTLLIYAVRRVPVAKKDRITADLSRPMRSRGWKAPRLVNTAQAAQWRGTVATSLVAAHLAKHRAKSGAGRAVDNMLANVASQQDTEGLKAQSRLQRKTDEKLGKLKTARARSLAVHKAFYETVAAFAGSRRGAAGFHRMGFKGAMKAFKVAVSELRGLAKVLNPEKLGQWRKAINDKEVTEAMVVNMAGDVAKIFQGWPEEEAIAELHRYITINIAERAAEAGVAP